MGDVVLPQIDIPKMATISLRGLKGKMPGWVNPKTSTFDKTRGFLTN
jgi:hypothetical protein